jgi:DNA-binding MurR/RpiR family transcriptional regulator
MDHTGTGLSVTEDTRNPALVELGTRVRAHWAKLSKVEKSVCNLLTARTVEWLLYASAAELAAESGTSNATVVRTIQRLGYRGLSDFKHEVATSFSNTVPPAVRLQQRIAHLGASVETIRDAVLTEGLEQLLLLRDLDQNENLATAVSLITGTGGTTHTYGIGISSTAAEFLAIQLLRVGRPSNHLAIGGFRFSDALLALRPGDVVVVLAPGRMTTEISVLLERAHAVDAQVILISDELLDTLRDRVAVGIYAPDSPTGTTSEVFTSLLICTMLVQAVAATDETRAVETSHTLTALREDLGY